MLALSFHTTHTYAFPYGSNNVGPGTISPTALTCGISNGDPYLFFLTQTTFDEPISLLNLSFDNLQGELVLPLGRHFTSGLSYDRGRNRVICGSATDQKTEIYVIDADTGLEVADRDLSADTAFPMFGINSPQAVASNGQVFAQSGKINSNPDSIIQMWNYAGVLLGEQTYVKREFTGMCKTPLTWTLTDSENDELVVLGPLGTEIAFAPGVGSPGGMTAVAYDNVRNQDSIAQLTEPPGSVGAIGTLYHPDTAWNPVPWLGRHRLYVANTIDQVVYAGYLTA